jgi:hypothetical protein
LVTATRIEKLSGDVMALSLSPSAFAFGFGAIASKRSEDGGERAGVRASVNSYSTENVEELEILRFELRPQPPIKTSCQRF